MACWLRPASLRRAEAVTEVRAGRQSVIVRAVLPRAGHRRGALAEKLAPAHMLNREHMTHPHLLDALNVRRSARLPFRVTEGTLGGTSYGRARRDGDPDAHHPRPRKPKRRRRKSTSTSNLAFGSLSRVSASSMVDLRTARQPDGREMGHDRGSGPEGKIALYRSLVGDRPLREIMIPGNRPCSRRHPSRPAPSKAPMTSRSHSPSSSGSKTVPTGQRPCSLPRSHVPLEVAEGAWRQDGDLYWAAAPQAPRGERWVVVRTAQGEERARKTLRRQVETQRAQWEQALWHLGNQRFACVPDAQAALAQQLKQRPAWLQVESVLVMQPKHRRPGRPRKDAPPDHVEWQVLTTLAVDEAAVARQARRKAAFLVATNVLDPAQLSPTSSSRPTQNSTVWSGASPSSRTRSSWPPRSLSRSRSGSWRSAW